MRLILDHDDFGSNRSKVINVIDSETLEHDVGRKPLRTFRHHALTALALVAMAIATDAQAASFDCTRARTPDEKAVCRNPGLSQLDSQMAALWYSYKQFPFLMGMSGVRRDEAQQFLADRGRCGANVACLRRVYQARIKALKAGIRWGMQNYTKQ